jgi:outer membrane protein assembly factor BamB
MKARAIRRIFASLAFGLLVVLVAVAVLYQFFGLRFVMDGGGIPRPRFPESPAAQAERIRQHREAQRARFAVNPAPETSAGSSPGTEEEAPDPRPDDSPRPPAPEAAKTSAAPPAWTDFRGPLRDGVYRAPLPAAWPPGGLQPLWKQPSGAGYASFVTAGTRAFTIEQRGPEEVVAAYDIATGRELWTNAWRAEFRESMGGDGPRATPTWADGRVFALGAEGEFRAIDAATGRVAWRTNILEDAGADNLPWGMAASPLVVDATIVVQPGGRNGRSVVAYDRASGRQVWAALDDQQSYASPMLVDLAGERQILVFSASRLAGLAPGTGELLWEFAWPGPNGINAAQPLVIGDNRVFISSGYGTGAAVVEVSRGPSDWSVREVWRNNRMKNRFASSVLHQGHIYGLDESILACLDAATGELKWKGGRYGYGQVVLAGANLIVLTEDGDLALVRATPERHDELVRFAALSGKTWNVPAVAGGVLLVRNLAEMAGFDLEGQRATGNGQK